MANEYTREYVVSRIGMFRPELATLVRNVGNTHQVSDHIIDFDGISADTLPSKSHSVVAGRYLIGNYSSSGVTTFDWDGFVPSGPSQDAYSEMIDQTIPYIEQADQVFDDGLVRSALNAIYARRHHEATIKRFVAGIEFRAGLTAGGEPFMYRMLVAPRRFERAPAALTRVIADDITVGHEYPDEYFHFAAATNLTLLAESLALSALHHQHIEAQLDGRLE